MSDEIKKLRARIARIEAKDACISTFNEYCYYLDGELIEDLILLFAKDAHLEVMQYPPGSGINLEFKGREDILPLYEEHKGIMSRHHAANVTVNINPDGETADLSAYFITAINYGMTGGLYEATFKLIDGKWLFTWLRICSNWGWIILQEYPPILEQPLRADSFRKGRPVIYELPEPGA